MATEPTSFVAFIVAGFVATLSWAGGLTKMSYENKGKLAVLDERTRNTDDALQRICAKLDKIIEHLLDKED